MEPKLGTKELRPILNFDLVNKVAIPVVIRTEHHYLLGNLYCRPKIRLIDDFMNSEKFWAVTNVIVVDGSGKICYRSKFIIISRDKVEWVIPRSELVEKAAVKNGAPGETSEAEGEAAKLSN